MIRIILVFTVMLATVLPVQSRNFEITSFNSAKALLLAKVYYDKPETLYCGAFFDVGGNITPQRGFTATKYLTRSQRLEWEHVVPVSKLGVGFPEWSLGHEDCVTSSGNAYKGRVCALKMVPALRLMASDLFNIYPSIGAVNALRSNLAFTNTLPSVSNFGSCNLVVANGMVSPPIESRGRIARTHLYMDLTYPDYRMSRDQRKLMVKWDDEYPVTGWECIRANRISRIQHSRNEILDKRCLCVN